MSESIGQHGKKILEFLDKQTEAVSASTVALGTGMADGRVARFELDKLVISGHAVRNDGGGKYKPYLYTIAKK